jgi:type 1 glutamine amidotransferase
MRRLLIGFVLSALLAAAADPARIVIITGESDMKYHNWREQTAFFEQVLQRSGRFDVRRIEDPRTLTSAALARYDAAILAYNGPRWGKAAESALEEFVRSGKGLVSFHNVTYGPLMGTIHRDDGSWDHAEPWAVYPDILGVSWQSKNIGHAARGAFTVKVAGDHPITRGMAAEFPVNDELYHKMDHRPGVQVLANAYSDASKGGTGKVEPIAWTHQFGKGRVFHCTLGHDINALYSPHVAALVARSTEWAATGAVTLPAAVEPRPIAAKNAVRVLVVTGGHDYEPTFYGVFDGQSDVNWTHVATQREAFNAKMKERWDVVVLYDMHNNIGETEAKHLREYVEAGKGVVALHHAIVNYTSWPWWHQEVIGGKYFEKPAEGQTASQYKHDMPMTVRPVKGKQNHPVVRGVGEIVTMDEWYRGMWHSPNITPLMEIVDNDWNDKPVVYLGPNPNFKAVYIQLGHDSYTHQHPGYKKLVRNAILWSAGRVK